MGVFSGLLQKLQGNETLPCCFLLASLRVPEFLSLKKILKPNLRGRGGLEWGNKKIVFAALFTSLTVLLVIKDVFDPAPYHSALFIQNLRSTKNPESDECHFSRNRERTRLARPFHALCVQTIYEFLLINNDGSCSQAEVRQDVTCCISFQRKTLMPCCLNVLR